MSYTPKGYILIRTMKSSVGKCILIFSVFCIIAVWIFGVFFMHKINDHGISGCFAAAARNTDCPQTMSTLEYIAFHAGVFHVFSNSTSVDSFITLIFLSFFVFLFSFALIKSSPVLKNQFSRRGNINIFRSIIPEYFLRWFSFHEKRDPLVVSYS